MITKWQSNLIHWQILQYLANKSCQFRITTGVNFSPKAENLVTPEFLSFVGTFAIHCQQWHPLMQYSDSDSESLQVSISHGFFCCSLTYIDGSWSTTTDSPVILGNFGNIFVWSLELTGLSCPNTNWFNHVCFVFSVCSPTLFDNNMLYFGGCLCCTLMMCCRCIRATKDEDFLTVKTDHLPNINNLLSSTLKPKWSQFIINRFITFHLEF